MNKLHPIIPRTTEEKNFPIFFKDIGEPELGDIGRWTQDHDKSRVWVYVSSCSAMSIKHWCCPRGVSSHNWIDWDYCRMRKLGAEQKSLEYHLRNLVRPDQDVQ